MQDHFDAMLEQEETRYLVASPRFSALMSAFVMGLGQLFNGQTYRGLVFLFGQLAIVLYSLDYALGWSMSVVMTSLLGAGLYKGLMVLFWVGGFLMWLYNVRDAYIVAEFCRFIFDRSTPLLDEEETEAVAEQLAVSTLGMTHHRGMRIKFAFLAGAVVVYGVALFYVGSFVSSRSREEGRLQEMIAERPDDAFLHLQLGEIYLSMGGEAHLQKAEDAFKSVVALSHGDAASRKIAYTNLSKIYTQRGQAAMADEMLQKALAQRLPRRGSTVVGIPGPRHDGGESDGTDRFARDGDGTDRFARDGDGTDRFARDGDGTDRFARDGDGTDRFARDGDGTDGAGRPSHDGAASSNLFGNDSGGVIADGHGRDGASSFDSGRGADHGASVSGDGSGDGAGATRLPPGFAESDLRYVLDASERDLEEGRPAEAGARLAGLPGEVRRDPRVVALMSRSLLREGKPVEALALAESHLAEHPEHAQLVVALSDALIAGGKPAEAEARLQGLLARKPENLAASRALAAAYVRRSAWDEADMLLGKALLSHPRDMELLYRTYQVYRGQGKEEKAYQTALALADTNCPHVGVFQFIADQAARRDDWSRALVACQELIAREPGKGRWHRLKADILMRKGDRRLAIATLRDATQLAPADAGLWAQMGDLARDDGTLDEAAEYYRRAARIDGRNVDVMKRLGQVLREQKKYAEALLNLDKAVALAPNDAGALYERGRVLFLTERWNDAAQAFSELFRVAPGYEEVAYFLGRSLENVGMFAQAEAAYRQVPDRSPRLEDARMRIGRLSMLASQGGVGPVATADPRPVSTSGPRPVATSVPRPVVPTHVAATPTGAPRAIAAPTAVASASGSDRSDFPAVAPVPTGVAPIPSTRTVAPTRDGVAVASHSTEDGSPKAVPISIGPLETPDQGGDVGVDAYADVLRDGEMAFRDKRWADALSAYDRVLAVRPGHHRSLAQRGIVLRELGRPREAAASFGAALRQRPDDVEILMEMGQLQAVDLDDGEAAVPYFMRVLKLDPKNMACRYSLGLIYEKSKNYEKAEEQYRAIAWYYPTYLKAYDFLGNVLFIQRKFSAAAEQFQKILARDPNDGTVRFKLGLTLLELNDREGAKREFGVLKASLPPENQLHARVSEYLDLLEKDG